MTNLIIGFLAGLLCGAGGVIALMYKDWQECKRVAKLMALRLEEDKTEGQ